MAGRMKQWAGAALIALALTAVAGQASAITLAPRTGGPLGGPRWTEVFRAQWLAGATVLTPGGALLTLGGRTIGTYGRAGWGDYRLRAAN